MRHTLLFAALAVFGGAFAEDAALALPPFIITGRVVDYDCAGLESGEVRIRKGSLLLARGAVGAFGEDTAANYSVAVPMANINMANAAQEGESLSIEIDTGGAIYADANLVIAAASPGRTVTLNLKAAVCTNTKGVADQYLRDIRYDLEDMGLAASDYDPDADYDGDGVTNYEEYLAGTDAFDRSDAGVKILSWREVEGNPDLMEATFLPGRGRAYSAERAGVDGGDAMVFEHRPHQTDPAPGAPAKNYLVTGNSDPEVHAVYLYKEGAASLYRLRLE
ncbi:MAG: hypothetical protein IJ802_01600 [Kiritimatiellae bacterium]|nr:hypothetical protein [Kiritimatiellia bacterium]